MGTAVGQGSALRMPWRAASETAAFTLRGVSLLVLRSRSTIKRVLATQRQRIDLRDLDSRMLKDVGLTQDAVEHECRRPFWDV